MTAPTIRITPTRAELMRAVEAGHARQARHYPYDTHRTDTHRCVSDRIERLSDAGLVEVDKTRAERWYVPWALTEAGREALAAYDAAGGA